LAPTGRASGPARPEYAFADRITHDDQRAIAVQLYVELLKGGHTSVVEFRYLHRRPDGGSCDDPVIRLLS